MMKNSLVLLCSILWVQLITSQSVDPLRTVDAEKQQIWVDSILNVMTIDEKIGQLFMVQAYSNSDEAHENTITELIEKYHVGNLIFMQGTPEKQALLTNKYQAKAKVPLLIGFDGEWGLDMRLQNTYRFPWNMTLGAIQDNRLISQFGEHLGKHCKRLGIHVNFAPVVDVNTNPKNPIIGNRSFGESKENVTQKAISFTTGMQSQGVLANAKHFPGHGDTATDSHHSLPFLGFDRARLDTVELYPYQRIFDAGITSVMTAHLNIPSLEKDENLPTSLSKNVVTKLLQQELGFRGLIFTDGLNMKGASNYATSAAIDLAAIKAGNDMLLIPQDVPATINLIKNQLQFGGLTEARINFSVKKILKAKYWAGLHQYQPIDTTNLVADLNTVKDELLHRALVKNSLTVVKNSKQLLPIKALKDNNIAYVKLGDAEHSSFLEMLKNYTNIQEVKGRNSVEILPQLANYQTVIIGFHKSNAHPWKPYTFTTDELILLDEISNSKNVILDVFASPYALLQIKTFLNIEAVVVSYQNSKLAQELSAQLIFGAITGTGKLPVSINENFTVGHGIATNALSRLQYSIPEEVNLSSTLLAEIDKTVDTILTENMSPGLQILVARRGKVVYQKSFGYFTTDKKQAVTNSSIYDVASLTKILASVPIFMKAEEEGKLSLDKPLYKALSSFKKSNKDTLTFKEILSHVARLQPWIPFYRATQDSITGENLMKYYSVRPSKKYPVKVAENLYLEKSYKDSIYAKIRNADQREEAAYKYSDLGYYILKEAIEKKYRKPFDEILEAEFYSSLGLDRTSYLPLNKFSKAEIVPTEKDSYYRNQVLQGNVHDMGAAMLGGVSGHAGLFANTNDVAKIMQMYLQKGFYGGKRYLKTETVDKFNRRYYEEDKVRRGVGFDKPQLDPEVKATCGCVSDQSFGHSGFTGTYTWADPKSEIIYVFLSNRVYPTMENNALIEQDMRTKIQQIIQNAILEE